MTLDDTVAEIVTWYTTTDTSGAMIDYHLNRKVAQLHQQSPFFWTEAGRDPVEHFAESYAKFVLHKEIFRAILNKEYVFMTEEVFKGGR